MDGILRKLRGVLGTGFTWGVAWAALGVALTLVVRVLDPDSIDPGEHELLIGSLFGLAGFLCGSAFGLLVSLAERRQSLRTLSVARTTFWGALGSATLPFLTFMPDGMAPIFGVLGAVCAGTTVAIARRVALREGDVQGLLDEGPSDRPRIPSP